MKRSHWLAVRYSFFSPRRRFYLATLPTQMRNHFVGTKVYIHFHSLVFKGEFGVLPEPLKRDCFDQGGYCLDAPNHIPAGSMRCEEMPELDAEDPYYPAMSHVWRDA